MQNWLDKSNFYGSTEDVGMQTDEDIIIENLKSYVSALIQKIKMLEHELKVKSEIITSLSNGNSYLQQQCNLQLDLIKKLTPNIDQHTTKTKKTLDNSPEKYSKLKSALMDAEKTIRLKERLIRSLTANNSITSRNNSESIADKTTLGRHRKRNQESSVGELLRWGIPERSSSIPPITCKITERSFEFAKETDSIVHDLKTIEDELVKEIEKKVRLEEKYNAIRDLTNSLAQSKKRALEYEIKKKANNIRDMESEIKCFKAYHDI